MQVAVAPSSLSPKVEEEEDQVLPQTPVGCLAAALHHIIHPAPHHPPSPTSHTLVPPPRQEMRTGFFVLPAEAPQRSRFLRGTTSPPGTQPPPSLYPTCATSCPQGRDRGAEPPLQGQPHSPCPTLVLGPVPLPVQGPVLFKVPRVMA